MKAKSTRLLGLLLAVLLCIGMLPSTVSAANEKRVGLTLHTGSNSSTSIVAVGREVSLPMPTEDGYIFDGWYKDEMFTEGNGPMMKILIEDTTELWAKMVPEEDEDTLTKYTLSFDTDEGDAISSIETTYGVTVDLEDYVPNREGYIFTKWFEDEELNYEITSVIMTENTTVYAGWIPLEEGEARYQQKDGGDWIVNTLAKACEEVYDGGTIEILRDVEISAPISFQKAITIKSADSAQNPYTLKRSSNFKPLNANETLLIYGYNKNFYDVTLYLERIYIDGGALDGITARNSLISVSYANLVLGEDVSIQNNNNEGGRGGGIYSFAGDITLEDGSQIVNCEASIGGGMFIDGGKVKIDGGKIEYNTSITEERTDFIVKFDGDKKSGAGIYIWSRDGLPDSEIEFESGSISNNTAAKHGGGIYVNSNIGHVSKFIMTGGTVEDNEARFGAGIYDISGQLIISGGNITGNIAQLYGGGIYYAPLDEHCIYLCGNPNITGNTGDETENNVYMDSMGIEDDITRTIIITGPLNSDASVGVTRWKVPTDADPEKIVAEPQKEPDYDITEDDLKGLSSDDLGYTLKISDGNIVMTKSVRVGGLTISPKELTLKVGETARITATVTPDDASEKTVIWTSGDKSVAAVDENGAVRAKSAGKTIITAKTKDGAYTDTCIVTVTDNGDRDATTYYILSFESNGGSPVDEIRRDAGTRIVLNQKTEREGYEFIGWYTDKELTNKAEYVTLTKDMTVYAGWEKKTTEPEQPAVTDPEETGVSEWLNTADHTAYLQGYPENLFKAENNMTRGEAAQMFYNLLLNKNADITVKFDDVAEDKWYAKAVNTLASMDIIKGVGDNKFAPDRGITRAEFTVMAMRFAKSDTTGENKFNDVYENDWYYDYIVGSIKYGWISGYADGSFGPNKNISRAEVTSIVNKMLGRSGDKEYIKANADSLTGFKDLTADYWAYYDIIEAANTHDYTKTDGAENWK